MERLITGEDIETFIRYFGLWDYVIDTGSALSDGGIIFEYGDPNIHVIMVEFHGDGDYLIEEWKKSDGVFKQINSGNWIEERKTIGQNKLQRR